MMRLALPTSLLSQHRIIVAVYTPISQGTNYLSSRGYELIHLAVPQGTLLLFQFQTSMLRPLKARLRHHTPLVAPILTMVFKLGFFVGFLLLLFFEQWLRILLSFFIGKHPTGRSICKFKVFKKNLVPPVSSSFLLYFFQRL